MLTINAMKPTDLNCERVLHRGIHSGIVIGRVLLLGGSTTEFFNAEKVPEHLCTQKTGVESSIGVGAIFFVVKVND